MSGVRPSDALPSETWRLRTPLLFRLPRRTRPVSHVSLFRRIVDLLLARVRRYCSSMSVCRRPSVCHFRNPRLNGSVYTVAQKTVTFFISLY